LSLDIEVSPSYRKDKSAATNPRKSLLPANRNTSKEAVSYSREKEQVESTGYGDAIYLTLLVIAFSILSFGLVLHVPSYLQLS
jgi:hypothetical protein